MWLVDSGVDPGSRNTRRQLDCAAVTEWRCTSFQGDCGGTQGDWDMQSTSLSCDGVGRPLRLRPNHAGLPFVCVGYGWVVPEATRKWHVLYQLGMQAVVRLLHVNLYITQPLHNTTITLKVKVANTVCCQPGLAARGSCRARDSHMSDVRHVHPSRAVATSQLWL